jgi:CO/xanthine dehydrogenase Mo-binding subunit
MSKRHQNGEPLNVVGRPFRKVDARAKCVGQTKFADDIVLPRMLYCKILRSHFPHAVIKNIDASKALALPGVFAVVTGKDLPISYGILPVSQDEHALCIDKVRFIGDPVAAVAAIDEDVAFDAMNLIEVDYEPLNTISSIEEAVMIEEPRIHTYGDVGNIHKKVSLEFGDVEEGFAEADLIREDIFFYEGNTHLPMEQHAAVAHFDSDKKITLWSSTQTPHYVHRALAKVLEMPASHIRVIATPNGGGFGGKSDPFNHEIVVCKLAMITGRPVKVTLTARGSLLLSSRTSPGTHASQNRCKERRRDHRDALSIVPGWGCVRKLWCCQYVLHRRLADGHLQRSALQVRGTARVYKQTAHADQSEGTERHNLDSLWKFSSTRSPNN